MGRCAILGASADWPVLSAYFDTMETPLGGRCRSRTRGRDPLGLQQYGAAVFYRGVKPHLELYMVSITCQGCVGVRAGRIFPV